MIKFVTDSKIFAEVLNAVAGTTGASEVNLEVGKAGLLLVKADVKGTAHHERTDIIVDDGSEGDTATIDIGQFLGLSSKRGQITVEITDKGSLFITAKGFKGELRLAPSVTISDIENSKDTLELQPSTIDSLRTHLPALAIKNLFTEVQPFVMVQCAKGVLELLCMDSVHGALYRIPTLDQNPFSFDVSYDALQKLINIITEHPEAVFAVEENRIFVQSDRCSISFPKTQLGSTKINFNAANALYKRCTEFRSASKLSDIKLENLLQEVSACKHIASDKHMLSLAGKAKGAGYVLSYQTNLGRIKNSNKCESQWHEGDEVSLNPYLMLDFLESLCLFENISLTYKDRLVFSHVVTSDGYEAFNVCSCG